MNNPKEKTIQKFNILEGLDIINDLDTPQKTKDVLGFVLRNNLPEDVAKANKHMLKAPEAAQKLFLMAIQLKTFGKVEDFLSMVPAMSNVVKNQILPQTSNPETLEASQKRIESMVSGFKDIYSKLGQAEKEAQKAHRKEKRRQEREMLKGATPKNVLGNIDKNKKEEMN